MEQRLGSSWLRHHPTEREDPGSGLLEGQGWPPAHDRRAGPREWESKLARRGFQLVPAHATGRTAEASEVFLQLCGERESVR